MKRVTVHVKDHLCRSLRSEKKMLTNSIWGNCATTHTHICYYHIFSILRTLCRVRLLEKNSIRKTFSLYYMKILNAISKNLRILEYHAYISWIWFLLLNPLNIAYCSVQDLVEQCDFLFFKANLYFTKLWLVLYWILYIQFSKLIDIF